MPQRLIIVIQVVMQWRVIVVIPAPQGGIHTGHAIAHRRLFARARASRLLVDVIGDVAACCVCVLERGVWLLGLRCVAAPVGLSAAAKARRRARGPALASLFVYYALHDHIKTQLLHWAPMPATNDCGLGCVCVIRYICCVCVCWDSRTA